MVAKSYPPGTVLMRPTFDPLARNWGLILLRGVFSIIFGVLTLLWPGLTLLTLVIFYGCFALVDGVLSLIAAITKGAPAPRWWLALLGIVGIIAGILTLTWPVMTGLVLLYFIAGWAIAAGVFQIVGAIRLRKEIEGEWLLVLGGLICVVFGLLIAAFPGAGAIGLATTIGVFALAYGIVLIVFALRLRKLAEVRI